MECLRSVETLGKLVNFIPNVIQIVLRLDVSHHQYYVKEHS